jgi:CheY-like chemotaxis protein
MIETGTLYINKEQCQLNRVLLEMHDQYDRLIKEREKEDLGILLKTSIKNENFTVITDEKRLTQVMVNLIENAISLTDEGIIEFGYNFVDSDTLEFFVKDTGTGLSPERLEMVLKQFSKVTDTHMRPFDIISLRINLTRHIVQLLGGELKAESQLGQGSDFRFRLKIKTVKAEEKQPETAKTEVVEDKVDTGQEEDILRWKDKTILIAEDVESNFIYLQEILKPTGAKILWAENGLEALKYCRKNGKIDAVLMDILMPEMDGYEAAKVINQEKPELPILAQTAYHLDENEYKGAMNYFSKFLIKPIWSHDLINALSVHLG